MTKVRAACVAALLASCFGAITSAWAQKPEAAPAPPIDPNSIAVPDLAFTPNAGDARDYDKYFYFNRPGTDFATAYADIQECDNFARGLPRRSLGYAATP